MSLNNFYNNFSYKYTQDLPEAIECQINENDNECMRIKNALLTLKKPKTIPDDLNRKEIKKIAKRTNGSLLHCSGNCALLARCMLYNLMEGRTILAAKNTDLLCDTINVSKTELLLFQEPLYTSITFANIEAAERTILEFYQEYEARFFIIEASGKTLPFINTPSSGHSFNAVVLFDKNNEPFVQFVDAWKTTKVLRSKKDIKKSLFWGETFRLTYY